MPRFNCITPILGVRDVAASLAYYTQALGFRKDFDWPDESPTKGFAGISRDGVRIFLCQGESQSKYGSWLSIFVDNVDAVYAEYQKSGARILQPPTNFPWGVREMNIADPDGNRLRIGSDSEGPADGVPLNEKPADDLSK